MTQQVSLRAVETFVVVARALSITIAANALGLTPSAVSRRISELETALGVDLFRRSNRRMALTEAGARYLASVGAAIDQIHAGSAALGVDRTKKVVRLSALSDFASAWLMPKLARLHDLRPDIEIELETSADLADVSIEDAHAGLRFGRGDWPGLVSERLLDIEVAPVCTPALKPASGAITAAALDRFTLLTIVPELGLWEQWFAAAGLKGYAPTRVQVFDSIQVLYGAAAAGMGLALGGSGLIDRDLESGRLVKAFDAAPMPAISGWYLVYRPRDRDWPPLRALEQVLLDGLAPVRRLEPLSA